MWIINLLNVINEYEITKSDLSLLLSNKYCNIENGKLMWEKGTYNDGKFKDLYTMSGIGNVYYYRNKFLFWTITPDSFKAFDEVYILTYLFHGQIQRYFYDLHNIEYDMKSVEFYNDEYRIVDYNPSRLSNKGL